MGIIFLALVANGNMSADADIPTWVIVSSASAIAFGTYFGGWRIVRTMGSKIIKMDPAQGFAAQGAGAAVILSASHVGFPLSTTHVMSGRDHGRGRGQAPVRGALGRGRQHRAGVGADAAVLGRRGRRDLRRGAACSAAARPGRSSSSWCCCSALGAFARRGAMRGVVVSR